jgi:light-regulated signal transduction histidine kinase (bacteriophytochrome)
MIASYVGLLSERYRGRLDERADRYIDYAVNGARRMQLLVDDLLHYARAGTKGAPAVAVDMSAAAAEAQVNLGREITDANAVVEVGPLPIVQADRGQMVQVFQNLLSNAVKFHGSEPPKVVVSGRDAGKEWEFAIQDNGIGIDPRYVEKVFRVFRRLHTVEEFPGTGIGLALCRRIIERHGGRIWMEPAEGGVSVFRFTLPKQPPDRIELREAKESKEG